MNPDSNHLPIGQRIQLSGYFETPVILEEVRSLGSGTLEEAVISQVEADALFGICYPEQPSIRPMDIDRLAVLQGRLPDPLGDNPEMVSIHNPTSKLDRAKQEILAARFCDIPAEAIDAFAAEGR